jgi:tetrapyrrole methylase family protein/MazG family protein
MGAGITIVGLGPSSGDDLTRKAWEILSNASEIYLRTRHHPVIENLPGRISIHSFDDLYTQADNFDDVYEAIVNQLIELAQRDEGVIYAVPGDPSVGEATVTRLRERAKDEGFRCSIVGGISFIEASLEILGYDPLNGLIVADALVLADAHHPGFPPDTAVLIAQLHSRMVASDVKLTLLNQYPPSHQIQLISHAGSPDACVENLTLDHLDRTDLFDITTTLFVPPLGGEGSFEAFQETVAHLRAPEGCPWDREQTHKSLRNHLMEETFEALDAIDREDMDALKEELGDLLLQIVLQVQIATEEGTFLMVDVIESIREKLIRRHPHVFAGLDIDQVDDVLHNWEALKEEERNNQGTMQGLLDGVPSGLPALAQADEIQARVARVGFDWPEIKGVVEKLQEELDEVAEAKSVDDQEFEMGDLLFAVVNYARWLKIDAEAALRQANQRFRDRFRYVERLAQEDHVMLSDLNIDQLEALWQRAKIEHEK